MSFSLALIYIAFFIVAFAFSVTINVLLLKFVKTLGIRNNQESIRRWNSTAKPSLGGISFFIVFLFSFISLNFFQNGNHTLNNLRIVGILLAVTIGFLIGLYDDAYNTHPWLKFVGQIICGVLLIVSGTYIDFFVNDWLNYLLTLFWVVGIMNSINMLDNMDGVSSVVSIGILLAILGIILLAGEFSNPIIFIVLGGLASLIGFLFYNWNPSRMYMGDTGSQLLGILLASLGIFFFWNTVGSDAEPGGMPRVIMVAMAFVLPLSDTTSVFFKRISKGRNPFVGGKDHTTHHLTYVGLSDKGVAIFFLVFSLISAGLTILINNLLNNWRSLYSWIFTIYLSVLFLFLFFIALRPAPEASKADPE